MASNTWYVGDFETTDETFYNTYGCTMVWLWAVCDNNAEITRYGTDIISFITYLKSLYGKSIYFHNLKFDGSFILDYLLSHGYEYYEDLTKVKRGVSCLIGEMGEFYSITIKFAQGKQVHLYDSYKLLPFSVARIAKDFNLPIMKEHIDYSNYEVNEEKLSYIFHDVKIVAMALNEIKREGMTKMTTASCAYSQYSQLKGNDYLAVNYPQIDDTLLENFREAYRGGRSQVNPLYANNIVHNVKRYDINSMYPYIMHDMELPYGAPIKLSQPAQMNFEIYCVRISFSLKENHLPTLLKKGHLYAGDDTYYIETEGIEQIWISSIDLDLVLRNYTVDYLEYIEIYGFRTSRLLFRDYIDKWYAKKQVDKGAKKIVDKFMLNCLYGKFGSKHKGYHKIPVYDEVIDMIKYVKSPEEDMKHYYLPVAIAITSYAHLLIDNAIHETGIENFVYCDTDSVHTLGTLPQSMVDALELGKFKLEGIEKTAKYVRQKCYVYEDEHGLSITCAGMPENVKQAALTIYDHAIFQEFKTGFKMFGKLIPKRVKGGIILHETTFEIK